MVLTRIHAMIACLLGISFLAAPAQDRKNSVTPRDCVEVKMITGVWMNHKGTRVAYLVRRPNLTANRDDYNLYARDLHSTNDDLGVLLYAGTDISSVTWLGDDTKIAFMASKNNVNRVLTVSVDGKTRNIILGLSQSIEAFSLDSSAGTIAYALAADKANGDSARLRSKADVETGYRIDYADPKPKYNPGTSTVYIRHLSGPHRHASEAIVFEDPLNHERIAHLHGPLDHLSLSPDGKLLAVNYYSEGSIKQWQDSPWVRLTLPQATHQIMVIQDLEKRATRLGFKTVAPDSPPLWARDSKSFMLSAHSPVGSQWEQQDIRDHRTMGADANLFWVDVASGRVEEVVRHSADHHELPLFWRPDGDVIVHKLGGEIARFHRDGDSWLELSHFAIPSQDQDYFTSLASDGVGVIGVHQTVSTPENLFSYVPSQQSIQILTNLNPQLDQVRMATIRRISWVAPDNTEINGLLLMPINYTTGEKYPLVIQTKGSQGWFMCDSGSNHDPAFAPQPIAAAGMMYLERVS